MMRRDFHKGDIHEAPEDIPTFADGLRHLSGIPVKTSTLLTRRVTHRRPRTWRTRWMTWPWRPWVSHTVVGHEIPDIWRLLIHRPNGQEEIICHPLAIEVLAHRYGGRT